MLVCDRATCMHVHCYWLIVHRMATHFQDTGLYARVSVRLHAFY